MAELGCVNELTVIGEAPYGMILDGEQLGDILLPIMMLPEQCKLGDTVRVFIYLNTDEEVTASIDLPYATVGQFAYLKVAALSTSGAFLDWGLKKDLLVPVREQSRKMQEGRSYLVYVNLDERGRVMATSKIEKFLDKWPVRYEEGDEVDVIIAERTDIGIKAIVNNRHWGVIFEEDTFRKLNFGEKTKAYIKRVREDDKIDLILHKPGIKKVETLTDIILAKLAEHEGFLPLNDKSAPADIYAMFGESKKSFKGAIGMLYKQRKIVIEADGIRLQ